MLRDEKPVRIAIYARHSTDRQTHSTQDQIERCKRYCATTGYEVVAIYKDEGISGAALINRPGIRELIEESLAGDFDRVLAEDLSRFSRDQGDVAHFFKKMRFLDIRLETVAEGVINELHIGLKGTMNALYLSDLADKTHRGMVAAVLNGSIPGGRTYGYDVVHKLDSRGEPIRGLREINDAEATIVREIFDMYARGRTLRRICADLNRRKIPAPKGGKWAPTTLIGQTARRTGLLRQTLYKGIVTFNRMLYRKHPDTGRRLSVLRPESDWVHVPVPELAIIGEADFDRVQRMIEERSSLRKQRMLLNRVMTEEEKVIRRSEEERAARAARARQAHGKYNKYLVTGKLWCLRHATAIITVRNRLYGCTATGCPNRNLSLFAIMPLVLDALDGFDARGGLLDYLASVAALREETRASVTEMESRLAREREQMRNIFDAIGNRRLSAEIKRVLDEREARIGRLLYDIERARKQLARMEYPADSVDLAGQFKALFTPLKADPLDQKATRRLAPAINRIGIGAATDPQNSSWRRWVEISFDWLKLMEILQPPPPPGATREKARPGYIAPGS